MQLYSDLNLSIELYKKPGIISVKWLESLSFSQVAFETSFHILMEIIEHHNIKRLLYQGSKTMIHLPDEQYLSMISLLHSGFAHSKIKKIARIYVDKSERDLERATYFKNIVNEMQLEIQVHNFEDAKSAVAWLEE
jgi:hypothetical protein